MFMTGPIHHRVAKRWVRTAQIAMLVGAVGIVPILIFGMPSAAPVSVPDIKPADPKPDPQAQTKTQRAPGVDASAVASRFQLVANNPKPKPVEENHEAGTTPPPPPPSVKFLGAIMEATARAALLVIDNKQKMLWVGDKIGNVELVSVERDHVTIKENSIERRLDLAPRSGPYVTAASGAAPGPPMGANGANPNGISGENPANDSPEARETRQREMLERLRTREGRIAPR